jgi:hypothetical protein
MDRTNRLSVTSLYDRFTPPSVIYDNPDCNLVALRGGLPE